MDAKYGTKTDYSTEHTKLPLGTKATLSLHSKRFRWQYRNFVSSTTVSMIAGGGVMGKPRAMYAMTSCLISSYDASAAKLRYVYVADIIVSDL